MSTNEIILVELDQQTLLDNKNEVEKWFEHVLTVQYSLESMLTKAVPKIKEPHIKEALDKILEANKHHSKSIDD